MSISPAVSTGRDPGLIIHITTGIGTGTWRPLATTDLIAFEATRPIPPEIASAACYLCVHDPAGSKPPFAAMLIMAVEQRDNVPCDHIRFIGKSQSARAFEKYLPTDWRNGWAITQTNLRLE